MIKCGKQVLLVRLLTQIQAGALTTDKSLRIFLSGMGEGGRSVYTLNFLYKYKSPLQKENLCPIFRVFPASAGS